MEAFWTFGVVVSLVANLVFLLVVLSFARELGIILVRIGPAYSKETASGPAVGERLEPFEITDLQGNNHWVSTTKFRHQLLLFLSPACSNCKELLPGLHTLAKDYRDSVQVFAVSSGEQTPEDYENAKRLGPLVPYVCRAELHSDSEFAIHGTPYAVLLDSSNSVVSKGMVNNLQHLESLLSLEVYKSKVDEHSSQAEVPESVETTN